MSEPVRNSLKAMGEEPGKAYLYCGFESLEALVGFINGAGDVTGGEFTNALLTWLKKRVPPYFHNGVWWDLCQVYYSQAHCIAFEDVAFDQAKLLAVINEYLREGLSLE
jgi:hypothetical protein